MRRSGYPSHLHVVSVAHSRNGAVVPIRVMGRRHRPRERRIDWTEVAGTILGVAILCALSGGVAWLIGRGL